MEFLSSNVKLLCLHCHLFWWHKNPIEAHEWLTAVLPADRLKKLKLTSCSYLGPFDPKLAILGLEDELKKLNTLKSLKVSSRPKPVEEPTEAELLEWDAE